MTGSREAFTLFLCRAARTLRAMVQALRDIATTDWQPALDAAGDILAGLDELRQSIRIILTTPQGSDPHRPTFASNWWRWLDRPVATAVPRVIADAWDALTTWEPRIEVLDLSATLDTDSDGSHVTFRVSWRPVGGTDEQVTEVVA